MRFGDLPASARGYVTLVCAASVLLVALTLTLQTTAAAPLELAMLVTAAAIVAHSFPVSTPGKQAYHVSLPFFVAAIVLLSPLEIATCIAAVHVAEYWRRRRSGFVQLFNAAAYALAALAAHGAFVALSPMAPGTLDLAQPRCVIAACAAALVFALLNRGLVCIAIWLGNGIPPREQHMFARESLLTDGVLLLMGLPLAQLAAVAPWAAAMCAAPLWLIHRVLDLPNVRAQRRQDGLTELFSAPYLNETCLRELNRARRFGRKMALLLLDLDGLGELNADFGAQAGDALIRATAGVIRQATREYDLAARLAGGMFAVLLPETDMAQAQVVVERMRRMVAERRHELPCSLEQVRMTVSIGAVISDGQIDSAAELFSIAEQALALAKRAGGNRSEFAEAAGPVERLEAVEPLGLITPKVQAARVFTPRKAVSHARQAMRSHVATAGLAMLAAAAACAALLSMPAAPDGATLLLLAALVIVAETRTVEPLQGSAMISGLVPLLAGALLLGPVGALAIGLVVGGARAALRRGSPGRVARETSAAALLGVSAAVLLERLGGVPFLAQQPLLSAAVIAVPPVLLRFLSRQSVERAVDSARQLRTLNEQLEHQAFHDPLTNLANRALFSERLEQAIRRPGDGSVAVLFLDLDDFKTVNDTLGHAAGDALLTIVTQRLRQCVRWEDTIARLGGDEFTILIEDVHDVSQVARSADRIAEALSAPFVLDGHEARVSASIGIALDTDRGHTADDLLREADLAMYRAKSGGKSRFEIFDPSMGSEVMERLDLEAELRQALAGGELELRYEVQDAFGTRAAMAGWRHARRGLIEADELIALAEGSGLAAGLRQWALGRACAEAYAWRDGGQVCISLTAGQLEQPGLVEEVAAALHASGLPPGRLVLELQIGDAERMRQLNALGVHLAVGEFVFAPRPRLARVAA